MDSMMNEAISFEDKYVIFLDLLGWQNSTNKSVDDDCIFNDVLRVIKELDNINQNLLSHLAKSQNHQGSPRVSFFSDSFIISIPFLGTRIDWPELIVLDICKKIARATIKHGFVVRGGVTRGKIVHSVRRNICFGPALVRAYYLESQIANYPRIVVDPNLVEYFENHYVDMKADDPYINKAIYKSVDGLSHIDYLAPDLVGETSDKPHEGELDDYRARITQSFKLVKENLQLEKNLPLGVQQKYLWFYDYVCKVNNNYQW